MYGDSSGSFFLNLVTFKGVNFLFGLQAEMNVRASMKSCIFY